MKNIIYRKFTRQKMSVLPVTLEYILSMIHSYIDDRIEANWITVIDDVYENLRQRAYEIEVMITNQPIDIEECLVEYENFKLFIDGFHHLDSMNGYKLYHMMAYAGMVGKKVAASRNSLNLLKKTVEHYVVEKNLIGMVQIKS